MIGAFASRVAIRQGFAASRRKDLPAVMRAWADDGVFEFPGHSGMSGRHEGKAAIQAFWDRVFTQMETFDIRPVHIALARPYALGTSNTAIIEWVLDETAYDGTQIHLEGVAVIEGRGRRIVHARDYIFDPLPAGDAVGAANASCDRCGRPGLITAKQKRKDPNTCQIC